MSGLITRRIGFPDLMYYFFLSLYLIPEWDTQNNTYLPIQRKERKIIKCYRTKQRGKVSDIERKDMMQKNQAHVLMVDCESALIQMK